MFLTAAKFKILTVVAALLAKCGGHECEQRKPQGDKDAHVAQIVVVVQLVHQEYLKVARNVLSQ